MKYLTLTSLNAFDPLPSLGEKIARPSFSPRKHAVKEVKPNLWLHPDGKMSYEPPEPEGMYLYNLPEGKNYFTGTPGESTFISIVSSGVVKPPRELQIGDTVLPKYPPGFDRHSAITMQDKPGVVLGKTNGYYCVKFDGWRFGHNGGDLSQFPDCWWYYYKDTLTLVSQ